MRVVIAGGGFAGCAAAMQAARMGAEVVLAERTDMLCGTGAVGGIMRNNGRYTAAEEMIVMGAGELFRLIDLCCRHKNVDFPGHSHASLFDVALAPARVEAALNELGVDIRFMSRIIQVHHLWKDPVSGKYRLFSVKDNQGEIIEGDVFIDTTGTAGPQGMCHKYGNGCVSCILRCPAFGGRVSLSALCNVKEYGAVCDSGLTLGAMSGSCKLMKGSLSPQLCSLLDKKGVAVIPVPKALRSVHLDIKACQQYALPEFAENIILLDTGHAKLMTPYFPLQTLKKIPGFENARFEDPYAGGVGNSVRFTACAPRDDTMLVSGMENLFCAGEKSGIFVGHTEAIVTGTLAGYNAVRREQNKPLLALPKETACGDAISWVGEQMRSKEGRGFKYTFSGSVLFERMKERGLYTTDTAAIRERVRQAGMENIFAMQSDLLQPPFTVKKCRDQENIGTDPCQRMGQADSCKADPFRQTQPGEGTGAHFHDACRNSQAGKAHALDSEAHSIY